MTAKVIFLDIDGPMIPFRCWVFECHLGKYEKFDPLAVATVVSVLKKSGAKLVISSSWRDIGLEEMKEVLLRNDIPLPYLHDDWATPNLVNHSMVERPVEIRAWLSKHPEITHFVVLDDAKMDIENLIRVTSEDGIQYEHQLKLYDLLNTPKA